MHACDIGAGCSTRVAMGMHRSRWLCKCVGTCDLSRQYAASLAVCTLKCVLACLPRVAFEAFTWGGYICCELWFDLVQYVLC